jgi:hypothetical protein
MERAMSILLYFVLVNLTKSLVDPNHIDTELIHGRVSFE